MKNAEQKISQEYNTYQAEVLVQFAACALHLVFKNLVLAGKSSEQIDTIIEVEKEKFLLVNSENGGK